MAFSGFGEYLDVKRSKVQLQNEALVADSGFEDSVQLFSGHVFYLNGYLTPNLTMLQFKTLLLKHGGTVKDYLASNTTLILASQMTDSKMRQLTKPVVKPDWALDCIQEKRTLPWRDYLLFQKDHDPKQASLLASFHRKPTNHCAELAGTDIEMVEDSDPEELDALPVPPRMPSIKEGQELDLTNEFVKANISTAPGFIERFLSSSRLHHISTWKSDLKDFVQENFKPSSRIKERKKSRVIMHIDMDCFFASVGTRDNPQLATRPVAITHSQGLTENSTAEIASCNYAARSFGISNGMILRKAVQLCPNLVCLPYEFDKYDASSKDLYRILMSVADDIQVVSCDEAFIDVSSQVSSEADALELAQRIRRNVLEKTGCSASIGIGPNLLLTRLATKRAKPNGVFYLHHSEAIPHLNPLSLDSLPGVGSILSRKLSAQGIKTCHDLRNISLPALQKVCGPKTGSMLYNFCRGVDDRVLENKGRQSLGCEINWGIRFQTSAQVESFFRELCDYVGKKLAKSKLLGHQITIKAKKRLYKGEPPKLLGCGRCQDYSKSLALTKLTQDPKTLFKEAYTAFRSLGVPVVDIRGVGVHISKLVPNSAHQSHSIWGALGTAPVISPSKAKGPLDKYLSPTKSRNASDIFNDFRPSDSAQKVDSEVFNMLPPDIQAELRASSYIQFATPLSKLKRTIRNDMSIDQGRVVDLTDSQSHDKVERIEAPDGVDQDVFMELPSSIRKELLEARPTKRQQRDSPEQLASPTAPGPPLKRIKATPLPRKKTINWRPGRFDPSPSQIDQNVLQELPDFIREELLENIERQNNQKRKLLDLGLKIRGASFSSPAASSSSAPRPAPVALYTKASFRGHSDLPEVLIHIDSALKEEENTEHVLEDLRLFVLDLIQSYELDTAWCILRFLLKKFRGAGEESERFCQEIYNEVDDAVFCNFGYRLKRV